MVKLPARPERVRVRASRTGFGESVLVTVEYAQADSEGRKERHLLFDCGSTRFTADCGDIGDVARRISEQTSGKLDVLVISHRHKDHLSAFGEKEAGPLLSSLTPSLVLRPWTEDPTLTDQDLLRFTSTLADAQRTSATFAEHSTSSRGLLGDLIDNASDQAPPNQAAIATLDALAGDGRGKYLHAGSDLSVEDLVPGLTITVLGPPTLEQNPQIRHQTSRSDEYWMLCLRQTMGCSPLPGVPFPSPDGDWKKGSDSDDPSGPCRSEHVRWLINRLDKHQIQSGLRLIEALDDALNNTSLILLLEIGNLRMLFPGDAQIENWNYTLGRLPTTPELKDKLTNLDLYKVGHHGSRNATPKSLYNLWLDRPEGMPRLTTVMSTLPGVHGNSPATAVPRETLVNALTDVSELHRTDDLPIDDPYIELVSPVTGGPFTRVTHQGVGQVQEAVHKPRHHPQKLTQ